MKRVTGLGGIFFKTKDPKATKAWYATHLGLPVDEYGCSFKWIDIDKPNAAEHAVTAWSPFKEDTTYFDPSEKQFMINYRVEDLHALLAVLKTEGVQQVGAVEDYPYGKFAWILDPEGNKIELWEPKEEGF